jgi:hypothetical protein
MQHHNPVEQNFNVSTVSKSMLPKHVLFLYALLCTCLLMIQATQNNGATVPLTPDLPKVQSPYLSKGKTIMGHRKLLCSNDVTWPLEDGTTVTSD